MNEQAKDFEEIRADGVTTFAELCADLSADYGVPFRRLAILKELFEVFEQVGAPTHMELDGAYSDAMMQKFAREECEIAKYREHEDDN